jgi:uncharacterized surface protein with fasciclin (FAS1) repeats
MKKKNLLQTLLLALVMTFGANVFAQSKTIVGVAASNKDFSTLVAAVKAADLVDVLSSEGPFTVFAPTNEAFAKLPDGTLASLLKPENKAILQNILKYHVVSGKVMASAVVALIEDNNGKATIVTVNGDELTAQMKDGSVYLIDSSGNWSKVTATDVDASNGVIHVIDTVLLPKNND